MAAVREQLEREAAAAEELIGRTPSPPPCHVLDVINASARWVMMKRTAL